MLPIVTLMIEPFSALALLAGGVLGNAWFWSSYANRLYSLRVRSKILDRFRIPHDLAMVSGPFILLLSLLRLPVLLQRSRLNPIEQIELGLWSIPWLIAAIGLFALSLRFVHRIVRRKPPGYQLTRSEVVDVELQLGHRPIGAGPYQSLVNLPANQAFAPEFNEKRFEFAALPAGFDGLRVLHISDVHFLGTIDLPFYETVFKQMQLWKPDLIVFTGDLIDRKEKLNWVDTTFGTLSAPLGCYYILGNHDWHHNCDPIRGRMEELGWTLCAEEPQFISSPDNPQDVIAIAGDERPWMGEAPSFESVPENAFRLLLSHSPDNIADARRQNVQLMLSGHNHGGQVKLPVLGPVYSPSWYGVRYADGVFQEQGTTLHVSRGVSGKHPLRIRCRPEVSLLTLNRAQNAVHG